MKKIFQRRKLSKEELEERLGIKAVILLIESVVFDLLAILLLIATKMSMLTDELAAILLLVYLMLCVISTMIPMWFLLRKYNRETKSIKKAVK